MPVKYILLVTFLITSVVAIGYTYIKYSPKQIVAKAAYSYTTCGLASGNYRISCIAGSMEMTGIRYANCGTMEGCGSTTNWSDVWKQPINSNFGNDPESWWATKDNTSRNFIDCSGFVNVVFLLAGAPEVRGSSGTYKNLTAHLQYIDIKTTPLQSGDLLVKPGHIAIFNSYQYLKGAPASLNTLESTSNPNSNGELLSGPRTRSLTYFIYALRYTHPEKWSGYSL